MGTRARSPCAAGPRLSAEKATNGAAGARSQGGQMREARIPDDIKIIAQFLAGQAAPARPWQELTQSAFKLRRELKQRGGYRLSRNGAASSEG